MMVAWTTYIGIFTLKIIENALSTLRLIVVSNGRKWLGAILQFTTTLIWLYTASMVVVNIKADPLKVIVFALGSLFGSYIGSILEQKIALGNSLLTAVVDNGKEVADKLRKENYAVTVIHGEGKDKNRDVLLILVKRKKRKEILDIIKSEEHNALIISESAIPLTGGHYYNTK